MISAPTLRVSEIFHSLQGESTRSGLPTVFVRLAGCPLRCRWCDTAYAFSGGEILPFEAVMARVESFACKTVCMTGGEPLAQAASLPFMSALCDQGYSVSLETSGALDIGAVDARVARIVDIKPPDSGEADKNRWDNLELLGHGDELKFVLASRGDYEWAKGVLAGHHGNSALAGRHLTDRCAVLFSPVWDRLPPVQLAQWILEDRLPVRFQLQMHKILWGQARGR